MPLSHANLGRWPRKARREGYRAILAVLTIFKMIPSKVAKMERDKLLISLNMAKTATRPPHGHLPAHPKTHLAIFPDRVMDRDMRVWRSQARYPAHVAQHTTNNGTRNEN